MVSEYWRRQGKTEADKRPGRTFETSTGPMCNECCWGDHCDNPDHFHRLSCPFCLGTGKPASGRPTLKNHRWVPGGANIGGGTEHCADCLCLRNGNEPDWCKPAPKQGQRGGE